MLFTNTITSYTYQYPVEYKMNEHFVKVFSFFVGDVDVGVAGLSGLVVQKIITKMQT